MQDHSTKSKLLEKLSSSVTKATGSSGAFLIALSIIFLWIITGPLFKYSDTWQLVINTGTTIITFLMVFLIQRSQNKESIAIQLKLNELVASSRLASNRLIDVEDLTEQELFTLHKYYRELAQMNKADKSMHESHSIEEAQELHKLKQKARSEITHL
jgi:low affinity Fe/Cu permease